MRFLNALLGGSVLALLAFASATAGPPLEPGGPFGDCVVAGTPDKCGPNAPPTPHFAIVHGVLRDNGDDDGWADSRETVQMRLTVMNRMGLDLTGITARLYTDDPRIACILDPVLRIGDLAALEQRLTDESFTFVVGEVERTDVDQLLTAEFRVVVSADQFDAPLEPHPLILDLNLDAVGGAGPTVFFEGFEDGFGQFTTMHLDADLNPPDSDLGNDAAGVANADGYRCQYSDPARFGSASQQAICYPNARGAPDAFWFHVITERSYSGAASMHWGTAVDGGRGYTTPTAQLEAIATTLPVSLDWAGVCEADETPCVADLDCPVGQGCVHVPPVLSFKHQVSLIDHRFS